MIVYFAAGASHPANQHFYKAASSLREDCAFWIGSGDWVRPVVGAEMAMFFRGPNVRFILNLLIIEFIFKNLD